MNGRTSKFSYVTNSGPVSWVTMCTSVLESWLRVQRFDMVELLFRIDPEILRHMVWMSVVMEA